MWANAIKVCMLLKDIRVAGSSESNELFQKIMN